MESNIRDEDKGFILLVQWFNGKEYKLYKGEKYFSRGCKRLHTEMWKYHKGEIPKGYHVHHVDNNTHNNNITNLNLVHYSLHQRFSGKKRFKQNPEFAKEFQKKGIESAKEWHKSEEGSKWHSEQAKNGWRNKQYKELTCQQCGKTYTTRHQGLSKYCHNNCKAQALRDRRKLERKSL